MKGYDIFYTEPDTVKEMFCAVCGTRCDVKRNVTGPTGAYEAMAGRGHWHDIFTCPHYGKTWHNTALELKMRIEESPSKRLADLMRLDLEDILREQGIEPPGAESRN